MKNIILTGFMGTGKTAVGKEIAKALQMKFVDLDEEIEATEKMKINDIFSSRGEQAFRKIESAVIKSFESRSNLVISTGGGAVLKEENMESLRKGGIIFCLTASVETILMRTSGSNDRPLLKVDDPAARIRELLTFRQPFYERAGTLIDTEGKTPYEIAREIVGGLK